MANLKTFDQVVLEFFPEFHRNAVGFDPLFRRLHEDLANSNSASIAGNYPPYNIIQDDDDNYQIELAVAGFDASEISVTTKDRELTVQGNKAELESQPNYLHRGLAARSFVRKFTLGDHVEPTHVNLANGILKISLHRDIPEAKKPRVIPISESVAPPQHVGSAKTTKTLETKK